MTSLKLPRRKREKRGWREKMGRGNGKKEWEKKTRNKKREEEEERKEREKRREREKTKENNAWFETFFFFFFSPFFLRRTVVLRNDQLPIFEQPRRTLGTRLPRAEGPGDEVDIQTFFLFCFRYVEHGKNFLKISEALAEKVGYSYVVQVITYSRQRSYFSIILKANPKVLIYSS